MTGQRRGAALLVETTLPATLMTSQQHDRAALLVETTLLDTLATAITPPGVRS